MRVLMIEDDIALCEAVKAGLSNIDIDFCHNGADAMFYLKQEIYDVCVLDRMLPEIDGLTLLKNARADGVVTPVLMLTALARIDDRCDGLMAGADDYLAKPFDMRELSARIIAMSRRRFDNIQNSINCGNVCLNESELILKGPCESITISKKECELLLTLFKNEGKLISRNVLFGRVWGADAEVEEASLDSYIHFVRRRLACVGANIKVSTVRGAGYRLEKTND